MKALHPSDPITEVRGVPDESAVPSMLMNYQTVYTVKPQEGATGTWKLDGQLIPHPICFGALSVTDSIGLRDLEVLNSQLTGEIHSAKFNAFQSEFLAWRLAYASVTIYQDGPDLANQGTVVVCQKPVDPLRTNIDTTLTDYPIFTARPHAFHFMSADYPRYEVTQAMPNAYFGKSREGAYIPLKLTRTHQTWHSHRDLMYQMNSAGHPYYDEAQVANGTAGTIVLASDVSESTTGFYPFSTLNDVHYFAGAQNKDKKRAPHSSDSKVGAPDTDYVCGDVTSEFCNENWADFCFRNMAVTTSLSFFFRFGFECRLQPTSMLSPQLKISPPADEAAIQSYFAIARELKDAYPAEFNDLGKIWDVISSIAKGISPMLSVIPGVGPILAGAVPTIASVGDRIRDAVTRTKQPTLGSTASMADAEIVREAARPQSRVLSAPAPKRQSMPIRIKGVTMPQGRKRRKQRKAQ